MGFPRAIFSLEMRGCGKQQASRERHCCSVWLMPEGRGDCPNWFMLTGRLLLAWWAEEHLKMLRNVKPRVRWVTKAGGRTEVHLYLRRKECTRSTNGQMLRGCLGGGLFTGGMRKQEGEKVMRLQCLLVLPCACMGWGSLWSTMDMWGKWIDGHLTITPIHMSFFPNRCQ